MEIRVAFPRESQLPQSRATLPTVHAGCFSVAIIHRTLTWNCWIFNERTDVNVCNCTRGCTDTVRESALKADSGTESSSSIIIINPLTARVVGAPELMLQPVFSIFPCSPLPLGLAELQACPFPDVVFPPLPLSASLLPPFTVPCKMFLARPNERGT